MDNPEQKHQRRIRYLGTHPQSFDAKYKEHDPEKYAETIAKVIQKGNTPAGMHRPICVSEILDILKIIPGEIGLDCTLGYGGHSQEMLKKLENHGHLFALDADPIELPKTVERMTKLGYGPDIFTTKLMNFANIDQMMNETGMFDFVLADLGVSSMQIDNPDRGFSYKTEGPLDLRMNPLQGIPAQYRLKAMTQEEIQGMLFENADEPYSEEIARAIVIEYKKGNQIATTAELQKVIRQALSFIPPSQRDEEIKKSCQRSFQAIRIDVNQEFENLYALLEKLPNILKSGGRVAILSFHSGEDRLVKKSFQHFFREGVYREIAQSPIRPSMEEQNANPRARSSKLRYAIKM